MISNQIFNANIDDILLYDKLRGHLLENITLEPDSRRAPVYDSATLLRSWLTMMQPPKGRQTL